MKQPDTESGIRPGVFLSGLGALAVLAALVLMLRPGAPRTAPAAAGEGESVPESPIAAAPVAEAPAAVQPVVQVQHAPAAPVTSTPGDGVRRWTGVTRASAVGFAAPVVPADADALSLGLARFDGAPTFNYQAKGARMVDALRSAISEANAPASTSETESSMPAAAARAGRGSGSTRGAAPAVAPVASRSGVGGGAADPGVSMGGGGAPLVFGSHQGGAGAGASADGGWGLGGDSEPIMLTKPSVYAGQLSQASQVLSQMGIESLEHPVEAFREAGKLRRACVEELRLQRIAAIAAARQAEAQAGGF